MSNGVVPITSLGIALSLLPLLVVGWIYQRWNRKGSLLLYATARMVGQLLLMGFVLIAIFKIESPWMMFPVVGFVLSVSSWIALRPLGHRTRRRYGVIVGSLGLACGGMLAYVLVIVIGAEPLYNPRYFIPLAGMIFANAMSAISLAGERFDMERGRGEAEAAARAAAFNAAMIPQVNGFLAVGLVSLPGMMTGQILAGIDPLLAIRYQIVVMAMVLGSAGLAVALFLRWDAGPAESRRAEKGL